MWESDEHRLASCGVQSRGGAALRRDSGKYEDSTRKGDIRALPVVNDDEKWYTVHRIFINQHKLGNGATQSYRIWGIVTSSFRSGAGWFL